MQTTNTVTRHIYLPEPWIVDEAAVKANLEVDYNLNFNVPVLLDEHLVEVEPDVAAKVPGDAIFFREENVIEITFEDPSGRFHTNDYSVYLKGKGIVVGDQFVLKRITGFYAMPAERLL